MEDSVVDLIHRPEPLDCTDIWDSVDCLELEEVIPVQHVLEDEFEDARIAALPAIYDAVAARAEFPNLTLERFERVLRAMGYRILLVVGTDHGHAPAAAPAASAA
ncbi:hypothetical protein [Sinomonas sp. RB5]